MFDSSLQTTLGVNQGQSNINATVRLDIGLDNDSDSDSSTVSGDMDVDFDIDFSSGDLAIQSFRFTGGDLTLDDHMHFDLSFLFGAVQVDVDAGVTSGGQPDRLRGGPFTESPSIVSPNARHGAVGSFNAMEHKVALDEGTIVVDGPGSDYDGTYDLSTFDPPVEGSSTSATPGTIAVLRGASNELENTTSYSITVTTPIGIFYEDPDVRITGSGQVVASVADITVDFIPWNGLVGDVNQNGSVGEDDIDAFVDGWRSTNDTPGKLAYMLGDMNFDGSTNLQDAFILHQALKGQNMSFQVASLVSNVPEPSTVRLGVLGCGLLLATRRR